MKKSVLVTFVIIVFAMLGSLAYAQNYVGSQICMGCHNTDHPTLGYNIWEMYSKTGHPFKLNPVSGGPPVYPENTSPGVPNTPPGTSWSDFSYVIGGYGWKARFVKTDGKIFTAGDEAQYNLADQGWVPYHKDEDKAYNYGCFQCHTTGPSPDGSWNTETPDLGTFSEPGIRCEGCHGPGGDHIADPANVHPPIDGDSLKFARCGDCHSRGSKTNAIPVSGGFIKHHEQFNEVMASKHKDMGLTCATCHDTHIPLRYEDAAPEYSAIKIQCETCHPDKQVLLNGNPKANVTCTDCHMPKAAKSAIGKTLGNGYQGDIHSHLWKINTDPVPRDSMFADGFVKLDNEGHGALTLDFTCLQCHQEKTVEWASEYAEGIHENGINVVEEEYVGSSVCKTCHDAVDPHEGYNIYEEYMKTGHPYKLNKVSGAPPTYPENTSPGVPFPPPNTAWDDFSYVIGGYGWKARFVRTDGRIFTTGDSAQYNLADGGWVAYHKDEDKYYNEGCFQCHTTGPDPTGSWNSQTPDLGTFAEPGIRCEGCHGPSSLHVADPTGTHPPIEADSLKFTRCGDCHHRGSKTNVIPASGGFIKHHEQFNEMKASKHGDGNGADLTCATCHDNHIALRYPEAAGDGLSAIKVECSTCHPNHEILVDGQPKGLECVDCHMPEAAKSAIGKAVGNGWEGDVASHIWAINTDPVPKDSMFTADGSAVKLDENGLAAVTLDFVCLRCHQDETVDWAASYAEGIHENGIITHNYAGSEACKTCHSDKYDSYMKSGHPYKLTKIEGAPPVFPAGTSPGVPNPPADKTWNDISYLIGGFGWKARFMDNEGYILTGDANRQYNLPNADLGTEAGWVGYDADKAPRKPYTCGSCHTTGWVASDSTGPHQDDLPGIYGTWVEPGVRCEACHGEAGDHVANPTSVKPTKEENCGQCHSRGDPNQIDVSGGLIKHHEQYETLLASPHKNFDCSTCHSPHKSTIYDMGGFRGEDQTCKMCHSDKEIKVAGMAGLECYTCHMPKVSKSAVKITVNTAGGPVLKGDLHTHIFSITDDPNWNMFTDDGKWVRKDAEGEAHVTMDFACLTCHTDEDKDWAIANVKAVHETGVGVAIDKQKVIPESYALYQNYPNPFNPTTTIAFDLKEKATVELKLFNANGQEVATLLKQFMPAGNHEITISAEDLPSGIYVYQLKANDFKATRKMLVLK